MQQQLRLNKQQEAFEEASKTSDIKLNATYFNRREFQDYVNISISIPLSIYNTENIKVKKAQLQYLKTKDDLRTLKQNFIISNKILQKELDNSYKNHELISKDIISLQKAIEKSLNINNRFKNNTTKIIQNLNKTISLKIAALDEKTKYFTALSKAIYYEGE